MPSDPREPSVVANAAVRTIVGGAVLSLAPLIVVTAYLWVSRTYDLFDWQVSKSDYASVGLSIAVGLIGVLVLPLSRVSRAVLAVVYVPIAAVVLVIWSLNFVCGMFGACL